VGLTLQQYRYLVTVADTGSITAAARALRVAQPSLSAQVQAAERHLGLTLFDRHPGGVSVRPSAHAFLDSARSVLAASDKAEEVALRTRRAEARRLRIGMIVGTQIPESAASLAAMRRHFPAVPLEIAEYGFDDPSAGLRSGAVDVAFVMPPFTDDGLTVRRLLDVPLVAVVPADHPVAERDQVSVTALFGDDWIVAETSDPVCRDFWLATALRRERPRVGQATRSIDKFIQLVAAGEAVGMAAFWVPQLFARPGVAFVPLTDAPPAAVAVAWPTAGTSPLVTPFVEIAVRTFADPVSGAAATEAPPRYSGHMPHRGERQASAPRTRGRRG
jgi:DNA-binding transcriptional LysR family regulator